METKICKRCGNELPITQFRTTRWGAKAHTCTRCITAARHSVRSSSNTGGKTPPFSDPDFDGKSLREVMDMMSRAKRWLESRGCIINLSGEYHETKIRKLKFE